MNRLIAANLWGTSPERRAGGGRISSPGDGAAGPRLGVLSPGGGTWQHPDDVRLNDRLNQAAMEMGECAKDTKASKQQTNVMNEFFQCCNHQCPHDLSRHALSQEKVTRFMMHQALRECKPRGGTEKSRADAKIGTHFDHEDCQAIIDSVDNAPICELTGRKICPQPTKPCGPDSFNGCKAILKKIHRMQQSRQDNARTWGQTWSINLDELHKHVEERKGLVAKRNCEEKANDEFASYEVVERHDDIEEFLWNDSNNGLRRSMCVGFRHRHCLLHLTTGILRAESSHRADTSDFRSFKVPKLATDIHDLFMMVNQIPHGKTAHGNVQYGRATRHKNVILCCIGALAFHLMVRICIAGEFRDFAADHWRDNSCWFDIKPLADVGGSDGTQEMRNDTCSNKIKSPLQALGIMCSNLLHSGRKLGAKILDPLQEEESSIDAMGQWAQSLRQRCHSSKLPMSPIRRLAGCEEGKHCNNPRSAVVPNDVLRRKTPIGEWCYDACNNPLSVGNPGEHKTAFSVLKFFCDINDVFPQDAATILIEHKERTKEDAPSRAEHAMFQDMPVFQTPEFKDFKAKMEIALTEAKKQPHSAAMESVPPGIQHFQQSNLNAVAQVDKKVDNLTTSIDKLTGLLESGQLENSISSRVTNQIRRDPAAGHLSAAEELLQSTASPSDSCTTLNDTTTPTTATLSPQTPSPFTGHSSPLRATTSPASPTRILNSNDPVGATATATAATTATAPAADQHKGFRMVIEHSNLTDLYNEWHGLDKHKDDFGGVHGRDQQCGSSWRKHTGASNHHHSRTRRAALAIEKFAEQQKIQPLEACVALEDAFVASKCLMSGFVAHCQEAGLLVKHGARGKAAKRQQQQQQQQTAQ